VPDRDDHRPVATILAEIRDVERFLADVPPHTGQGTRVDLQARLDRLRRELAAARRRAG
jgi:ribosome-interacting GTPase 1